MSTALAPVWGVRHRSRGVDWGRQAVADGSPPRHPRQRPQFRAAKSRWPAGFREPPTPPGAAVHTAPGLLAPPGGRSRRLTTIDPSKSTIARQEEFTVAVETTWKVASGGAAAGSPNSAGPGTGRAPLGGEPAARAARHCGTGYTWSSGLWRRCSCVTSVSARCM